MKTLFSYYLSLSIILVLAGCSTTKPHYENQYRQHDGQPQPFTTTVSSTQQALVDADDAETYIAAKQNADRVDQFGKPKGNIADQHITNWGRTFGGSLAGRYVDPATLFPVNQSFRPEHPNQVTYVMPNNTIVTTFVRLPTKEKFYLTGSQQSGGDRNTSGSSYSAVINPSDPVEIKSEEITQIGKIILAELRIRAKAQEDIANSAKRLDPYKSGSWKALTTNAPQTDDATSSRAAPAAQENLHVIDLCRRAGLGAIREQYTIPASEWERLVSEGRQPGSAYDIGRKGQILPMKECSLNTHEVRH